jgi:hypothetical protein
VPNLVHNSLRPNYSLDRQAVERNLWQLELACRGNFAPIGNMNIAAKEIFLHLLPLKHCGKPTVITSLRDVSQL